MPTKLPANQIIGATFAHVFGNLTPLARAGAVPYAILVLGQLRALWATEEGYIATYAVVLWMVIQLAAIVPYQTQVYRFAANVTPDSAPRLGWFWGRRETMFVLNSLGLLLLTLAIFAVVVAVVVTAGPSEGAMSRRDAFEQMMSIAVLVGAPAGILTVYLTARLGLVVAAAAVGHSTQWRAIWQATRGNGWRVVWIMIVTVAPGLLADTLLEALAREAAGLTVRLLLGLVAAGVSLIAMALPASAMALTYRHLVVQRGAPPSVSVLI